jgi:cytoskeletal protein RodZ
MDNKEAQPESLETGSSLESNGSLETSSAEKSASDSKDPKTSPKPKKKRGGRGINIYLLIFIFLVVLAGIIVAATYLASQKENNTQVPTQKLSEDTLKQLSTSNVTVGQPKQLLSVQSNAVFAGKVLIRDSLEVAGPIQVGGAMSLPGITVSGDSLFEQLQVNKNLSVQGDSAMQGQLTVQKNLSVSGGATFGGPISAPVLNVNSLQLTGNLTLTKHLSLGGATPSRTAGNALGGGGTVAISGSDSAGSVNINSGSSPSAGCFVTVEFAQRFNATPKVIVSPVGSTAGDLNYYVNRSSGSFSICTTNPAPAFTSFGFDYFAVE